MLAESLALQLRLSLLYIHTRPTVAWGPPPGAYRARAGSRTPLFWFNQKRVGKGLTDTAVSDTTYFATYVLEQRPVAYALACNVVPDVTVNELLGREARWYG